MKFPEISEIAAICALYFTLIGCFTTEAVSLQDVDVAKVRKERETGWLVEGSDADPWVVNRIVGNQKKRFAQDAFKNSPSVDMKRRLSKLNLALKTLKKSASKRMSFGDYGYGEGRGDGRHKCTTDPWCIYDQD